MSQPPNSRQAIAANDVLVGSYFLETLTTGMYENPFHCVREYVQNGFDAVQEAVRSGLMKADEGRILITVGASSRAPSLKIRDNGCGLAASDAAKTLTALGASRKSRVSDAGFRGIGRLAGIAYCTTLVFTTSQRGEPTATQVSFDCGLIRSYFAPGAEPVDVREVIRSSVSVSTLPASEEDHYTEVDMLKLVNLGTEFTDPERLEPYLREVCPVDYRDAFEFGERVRSLASSFGNPLPTVYVETKHKRERNAVLKPYAMTYSAGRSLSKLHDIETFSSPELGWFGWLGVSNFLGELTDDTVAGVRFRVKNIQVGNEDLIKAMAEDLTPSGSERRLMTWAVGEIFITNTSVVPNARRDGFEDNAEWRKVRENIRELVGRRVVKLVRSASTTRGAVKKISEAAKSVERALSSESVTSQDKVEIEEAIQTHLKTLSSRAKLTGADPKQISALTARFKELSELLKDKPIQEPKDDGEPDDETETTEPGLGDDDNGDIKEDGEDTSPGTLPDPRLSLIVEVLRAELAEDKARQLAAQIIERLDALPE